MDYKADDQLINKVTGEKIIIDTTSTYGCYYRVGGESQLHFIVFEALSGYEKVQSTDEKFVDEFTKGYLEACELLKKTPPAEWGQVVGNIGGTMKHVVVSLDANIIETDRLLSKFKTE